MDKKQINNISIRFYVLGVALVVLAFAVGISVGRTMPTVDSPTKQTTASPEQTGEERVVDLMIDYSNGTIDTWNDLSYESSDTIYNLLSEHEEIRLDTKKYGDMGIFINTINDVGNEGDGNWWQFWVNAEYATSGVSTVELEPDDVIEFKYVNSKQ